LNSLLEAIEAFYDGGDAGILRGGGLTRKVAAWRGGFKPAVWMRND